MVRMEVLAAGVDSFGSGSDSDCNDSILDQTIANEAETAAVGFGFVSPGHSCNGSEVQNTIHSLPAVEVTERGIGAGVAGAESEREKMTTVACSTKNLLRSCVVLNLTTRLLGMRHGGNTGRKNYDGVGFGGTYSGCRWTWYDTGVFR